MDYQQSLDYVLDFADFERWPGAGYAERWDLRRVEELLEQIGSPHLQRKTVHIAGSKGKGSTAAMIASALIASGYRTGLYTSPHLHTIRERIRIDDKPIEETEFAASVADLKPHVETINQKWEGTLSTFEILTSLAFNHFHQSAAEYQVLETGLGGRLDATNVAAPEVCVLTSISLDHTAVLGDSIAKIATEKAGIIKQGVTVISSPQVPEAADVIRSVCTQKQAKLVMVGTDIIWDGEGLDHHTQLLRVKGINGSYNLTIPLLGEHQLENAATAVGALEALNIDRENIASGLANVQWAGRLQILQEEPLLIADGAHNDDSARRLVASLKRYFNYDRATLIMGSSADKNASAMISEFAPFFDRVVTTTSQHPRATKSTDLADEFMRYGADVTTTDNVKQAISEAMNDAGKNDLICATGSLFLVAEVIEEAKGITGERYPGMEAPK